MLSVESIAINQDKGVDFITKLANTNPRLIDNQDRDYKPEDIRTALEILASRDNVNQVDTKSDTFKEVICELIPSLIEKFCDHFDEFLEFCTRYRFRLREHDLELGQEFTDELQKHQGLAISCGRSLLTSINETVDCKDPYHNALGIVTMKARVRQGKFHTGLKPDYEGIANKPINHLSKSVFYILDFFNSDKSLKDHINNFFNQQQVAPEQLRALSTRLSQLVSQGLDELKVCFDTLKTLRAKLVPTDDQKLQIQLWHHLENICKAMGARATRLVLDWGKV